MFEAPLSIGILGRAVRAGNPTVRVHDLREHGLGRHRTVDDTPYGGGAGMVLRPEPIFAAVEAVRGPATHVALLSPRGIRLVQSNPAGGEQRDVCRRPPYRLDGGEDRLWSEHHPGPSTVRGVVHGPVPTQAVLAQVVHPDGRVPGPHRSPQDADR